MRQLVNAPGLARRSLRRATVVIVAIGGIGSATLSAAHAASPAIRGTWVTTTGLTSTTSTVYSNAATTANFKTLRDIGLNTVYMDVWRNGYTYYNSPTNQAITGSLKEPGLGSRDLLAETTIQAHRNQMAIIGWFQYGLMAKFGPPGSSSTEVAKYMKDRGWVLQTSSLGYTNSGGFTYMNPLVPEVRAYLKGLVVDAVKNYNLDGIQFDDHLCWPTELGWDDYTRRTYLAETGRALPTSSSDANFTAWRASKITSLAQEIITAVKTVRPTAIVSLAPTVYPSAYSTYCVDWPSMRAQGMFDEFVPQVYRNTYDSFDSGWDGTNSTTGGQVQFMGNRRGDFAAGISINGSAGQLAGPVVTQMANLVDSTAGIGGEVYWYSAGVLGVKDDLKAYYNVAVNGQAPRPDMPANSLQAPVVGASLGGLQWQFNVTYAGYFDLIAANGDIWSVKQSSLFLAPGTYTFSVSSATQAELLAVSNTLLIPEPVGLAWIAGLAPIVLRRRTK